MRLSKMTLGRTTLLKMTLGIVTHKIMRLIATPTLKRDFA
jgi:hypothetical protein